MRQNRAFTLIELMIVVAIIGILAAIAIPKFAELIRKTQEGKTKGHLSTLRSALNIYYAENLGVYPAGDSAANSPLLASSLVSKYADMIPECYCPSHHAKTNACDVVDSLAAFGPGCNGKWVYVGDSSDSSFGKIIVGCLHQDLKGGIWSEQ